MRKRIISFGLAAAMVLSMAACGSSSAPAPAESTEAAATEAAAGEEGKVLNFNVWNEEFKTRVEDYFPGYEKVDATNGKIGDVAVKWTITPSDDNAYQNNLDERLLAQAEAADDDKLDIFLVEADYALKYVDTDYTMPLADLGLTDADFADQYQYTKDVVTDSNGQLKGASWQGCPGLLIYRRDIAKTVLGTDDPDEVQKAVADWDTFKATAAQMKDAGYQMTSTVNDTFRVFSNNVTSKWVEDGKLNLDDNIKAWVDMSKEMVDAGETGTQELWSDDWSKGFYEDSNVFCYFGPAWFIDFSMAADADGSVAKAGGWAATEGPQGFFWGGTWICAAAGTDNPTLVADIIKTMTTDTEILTKIVTEKNDFCNNQPLMDSLAADENIADAVLGGQNALGKFSAGVATVDLSNISSYDQGCNEEFQNAMKNYFDGNMSYEDAYAQFEKGVGEKYPELAK